MPTLPLIDLLILMGWTSLFVGATQKAIWITTSYQPTILTLTPIDFLWIAAACLLFALSLAARTWVKLNEGKALSMARSRRPRPEPLDTPRQDDPMTFVQARGARGEP
jgi:hypothetical protein